MLKRTCPSPTGSLPLSYVVYFSSTGLCGLNNRPIVSAAIGSNTPKKRKNRYDHVIVHVHRERTASLCIIMPLSGSAETRRRTSALQPMTTVFSSQGLRSKAFLLFPQKIVNMCLSNYIKWLLGCLTFFEQFQRFSNRLDTQHMLFPQSKIRYKKNAKPSFLTHRVVFHHPYFRIKVKKRGNCRSPA